MGILGRSLGRSGSLWGWRGGEFFPFSFFFPSFFSFFLFPVLSFWLDAGHVLTECRVMCVAVVCLILGNPGWSLYRLKGKDMGQEDIELGEEGTGTRSPSSEENLKG